MRGLRILRGSSLTLCLKECLTSLLARFLREKFLTTKSKSIVVEFDCCYMSAKIVISLGGNCKKENMS